jgi:hypothetical protein
MAGGHPAFATSIGCAFFLERLPGSALVECLLLARTGRATRADECLPFEGKNGHTAGVTRFPLMTQSGHLNAQLMAAHLRPGSR